MSFVVLTFVVSCVLIVVNRICCWVLFSVCCLLLVVCWLVFVGCCAFVGSVGCCGLCAVCRVVVCCVVVCCGLLIVGHFLRVVCCL